MIRSRASPLPAPSRLQRDLHIHAISTSSTSFAYRASSLCIQLGGIIRRVKGGTSPALRARLQAMTTTWLRRQMAGQYYKNFPM
jgi:hypothetical protein